MTDRPSPRAVVFDLDGLMFNTEDLYDEVGDRMLRRRGMRFTPELKQAMMGLPGKVAFQVMIDWHQLTDSIPQLEIENDAVFDDILPDSLELMPGLIGLLETLETAELPKAIATSSRLVFASKVLNQFDLQSRFEFVLTAEDVVHGKPNPEIYQTAAARLGVTTTEMLVFEDSQVGAKAAVAAGAQVVAVPNRHTQDHDFQGVSLVANTLADPRIIDLT